LDAKNVITATPRSSVEAVQANAALDAVIPETTGVPGRVGGSLVGTIPLSLFSAAQMAVVLPG
jgi:hypothetical protein